MKKIYVCYRMSNDQETAETCITLPMKDEIAADILEKQRESAWVSPYSGFRNVHDVLKDLTAIQGYQEVEFVMAEEEEK